MSVHRTMLTLSQAGSIFSSQGCPACGEPLSITGGQYVCSRCLRSFTQVEVLSRTSSDFCKRGLHSECGTPCACQCHKESI
jgi:uncharacterized Zn finger protein (UPF0148 family)